MTIKLVLLKSGEDIVADVTEMTVGEPDSKENPPRVIGYFLGRPCVVKLRDVTDLPTEEGSSEQRQGYNVSLFPWMPLSKEDRIPIPADWMITMVDPVTKLEEMYIEDIVKTAEKKEQLNGKDNQSISVNESSSGDSGD
tara:strand:+ start:53 stop:469 length:417 start_codon:yes stop_codon:yes gene_type:complete